jgi:hypothetical protein
VAQPDTGVIPHLELAAINSVPGFDVLDDDADPTDPLDGQNPGTAPEQPASWCPAPPERSPAVRRRSHMPIRAIRSVVQITLGTVAEAVDWAVEHGAHVRPSARAELAAAAARS